MIRIEKDVSFAILTWQNNAEAHRGYVCHLIVNGLLNQRLIILYKLLINSMKKYYIFPHLFSLLLIFLALPFSMSAQEQNGETPVNQEYSTSSIIDEIFSSTSGAPDGWELMREDKVDYGYNGRRITFNMFTYKHPNGKYISLIAKDETNYIWFWTPMKRNAITGEYEPQPEISNDIIVSKRLLDDVSFWYENNKKERSFVFRNRNEDGDYSLLSPYAIGFNTWIEDNKKHLYSATGIDANYSKTFSSKEEAAKHAHGWSIITKYGDKREQFELVPYQKDKYSPWELRFMKEIDGHVVEVRPTVDYLIVKYYITPDDVITLSTKDVVKSIEQNGNIVEIQFEHPGDFIKYSLYAHGIFDGKLTRKNGYFKLKNDHPGRSQYLPLSYYTTTPLTFKNYGSQSSRSVGNITVPAGLHGDNLVVYPDVLANFDSSYEMLFKKDGDGYNKNKWFYDDAGKEVFFTYYPGAIYHVDADRIAKTQEEAEIANIKQAEAAALAPLKQKYGATNVENVRNGIIKVGMPWKLVEEAFPYATWQKSGSSATYKVWNNKPQIDRENKKFRKVTMGFGQLTYVTVRNGKITNIYFSGHH